MELRRRKGTLGGREALCGPMLNAPRTRPKLGGPFLGRLDNRPGPAGGARTPPGRESEFRLLLEPVGVSWG